MKATDVIKQAKKGLPCPFCGYDSLDVLEYTTSVEKYTVHSCEVICLLCFAEGPRADSKKEAIKLWNKREKSKE